MKLEKIVKLLNGIRLAAAGSTKATTTIRYMDANYLAIFEAEQLLEKIARAIKSAEGFRE